MKISAGIGLATANSWGVESCRYYDVSEAERILSREAQQTPFLIGWFSWTGIPLVDDGRSRRGTDVTNTIMSKNYPPSTNVRPMRARLCRAGSRCLRCRLNCWLFCGIGWDTRRESTRLTPRICGPADCSTTDTGDHSARARTSGDWSIDSGVGECRGSGDEEC